MRILYLDCFSGISGDMTLGALVDAGADRAYIEDELSKIKLEPYTLEWKRVVKRGISALKLDVILDPEHPPKKHRHYSEIVNAIQKAEYNERVTALSLAIFEKIAIAEAKIHGTPIEKVHFHEVGAIDSIVDIVGVALAIDSLQIERIFSSPVPLGSGTIHIDHGIYPVPAPATLEMMKGLPIASTPYSLEMTTPTGAGIISGIVDEFSKSFPPMVVDHIGYGAGTRDLPKQPNVLRVVVGRIDPFIGKWQVSHEHLAHDHSHEHTHTHDDHHHHHDHTHTHDDHHHHHDHAHTHDDHSHSHDHKHDHDHHHDHSHTHTHHGDATPSTPQ
ncbi:nickel pincer cofactor biosynthesis protein LarC [Paenibacillus sp. LMG 31461]|uniref:Nickel pincer cofactor biosynthesis protein LarC n=1 Tax=Paenibacillus plantarum TaxID=2654975 RepID=A0ABX1X5T5_9BACL|nr:nickel pincer cofactor biosynthesis protein LarC [Paenibacillus plantarum]NOU63424.1 nickel pincer cofactor biosynthesis protein LarC [Paenibacillus plantarum]